MASEGAVLVTGGAGFLGTHLVRRLHGLGRDVRVLDDLSGGQGHGLPSSVRAHLQRGDVRDPTIVERVMPGCSAVVHLADRPIDEAAPREGLEVDVLGTLAVLQAAKAHGVRRVVLGSSCSVYGVAGAPPFPESRPPAPVSLAGASKVAAEALARAHAEQGAFQGVALRFFHVYGPGRIGSPAQGVLALFGREVAAGRPPRVHGSGEVLRDFVHVEDAVQACLSALERRLGGWTVANVGSGTATTIRGAAEAVAEALGRPDLEPVSVDPPPGPSVGSFADLRYARSALAFSPQITLAAGLARKDFHLPFPHGAP